MDAVQIAFAALVVSVISAGVGVWSFVHVRGQRRASDREADAAWKQVEQQAHEIRLLEEDMAERRRISAAENRMPPWALTHLDGEMYELQNVSHDEVHSVAVDLPPGFSTMGAYRWTSLGPGEAVTFAAVQTSVRSGGDVNVRWRGAPDADERSWTKALPPRPRRGS